MTSVIWVLGKDIPHGGADKSKTRMSCMQRNMIHKCMDIWRYFWHGLAWVLIGLAANQVCAIIGEIPKSNWTQSNNSACLANMVTT